MLPYFGLPVSENYISCKTFSSMRGERNKTICHDKPIKTDKKYCLSLIPVVRLNALLFHDRHVINLVAPNDESNNINT